MGNIYFISDTHFGHTNIIKYCNRPFKDVNEMNEVLINNWNKVVNKNDIVYHLGDFILDNNIEEVFNKLNGTIYLIKGNHDHKSTSYYNRIGFKVIPSQTKLEEYKFILSHRPLEDNMIPKGYINIYGHIHDKELDSKFNPNIHKCVSVEKINYSPISINELLKNELI